MVKYHLLNYCREEGQGRMIYKHVLGVVHFKATGDNTIKFVNSIRKANFICKNLRVSNNEVYGKIYGNNYEALCEIAQKNYMELEIEKKKGIVYKIIKYKKRIGIIAGIIVSLAIVLFLSNTVLKIRIIGCGEEVYNDVMNTISANGIVPGKFIPSLDLDEIENAVIDRVDSVSWVAIRSNGGIITVNVHQSTPKPKMISRRLPCNLVSTRDAQIIDIQVYEGQLMVLKGEGVKKGDLLVSGLIMDEKGKPLRFHAQAKIIGQYTETINIKQPLRETIKVVSDDTEKRRYLNFFSLKLPLSFGKDIKGEYTYKEKTNSFSFFSLKLPIGITYKTYSPYVSKKVEYTVDEAKNIVLNKINIYEANFLSGCEIINKDIQEEITDEYVNYKVTYVVQGDITKENEILIKNEYNPLNN